MKGEPQVDHIFLRDDCLGDVQCFDRLTLDEQGHQMASIARPQVILPQIKVLQVFAARDCIGKLTHKVFEQFKVHNVELFELFHLAERLNQASKWSLSELCVLDAQNSDLSQLVRIDFKATSDLILNAR